MNLLRDTVFNDYHMIFDNTLLILDKRPMYVYDTYRNIATVSITGTKMKMDIPLSEDTIIEMPRLGYINYEGVCIYWCRVPNRKFTFGVNSENTRIYRSDKPLVRKEELIQREFFLDLCSTYVYNTVMNIYPSLSNAVDMLQEQNVFEVAFDRQFSLTKELGVYYKSTKVGDLHQNMNIVLYDQYKCLEKALPKGIQ